MDAANAFVTDLHWAYRRLFDDHQKRVQGWRMTIDTGKTLIVAGRGVHGDDSEVSLGKAANRPAKYLYAQLELPEDRRDLKRYHVAIRRPLSATQHRWDHFNLDRSPSRLATLAKIAEDARVAEPKFQFLKAGAQVEKAAMAVPLAPSGSPASPSPEKPQTYFGWVMRADLDGFTMRVEECFDDNQRLQQLAVQFYDIMETAAEFVQRQRESLAQLPWAGDNFTAASVFDTKAKYEQAIPRRLVELTLDFEKEMRQLALDCGFGGWAHGVAGGDVHGNSAGNVYLAGVEVGQRRFLVGVGEGFGRSAKAFADINPKAAEVVVYRPDWERLDELYQWEFRAARTARDEESRLYVMGKADDLIRVRVRLASVATATTVTFPGGQARQVPVKPYCNE
jgi:hypothetical protein